MKILKYWFLKWRWKVAQAVEIRWWKNYLRDQKPTEYLIKKQSYWQRVLNQINLEVNEEDFLLDAGCGPAGIFINFDQNQVHALDPLLDQYETELSFFKREDFPWVQFHKCQLEEFDTRGQYDKVFCLNAINHVENIQIGFDRLAALVKENGTLVVSIDAHNYWGFKHLFRLLPGDILHPHQYDIREYREMLETRGMQILDCINLKQQFFFDYYILTAKKINHGPD